MGRLIRLDQVGTHDAGGVERRRPATAERAQRRCSPRSSTAGMIASVDRARRGRGRARAAARRRAGRPPATDRGRLSAFRGEAVTDADSPAPR